MQLSLKKFIPFILFALTLTVYVLTLCPTVYVGDSGELITAAATLSIPHPTGFPLYTLSGKLFLTLFPFLDPAWGMNLFSAIWASLTIVLVYLLMEQLQDSSLVSSVTALVTAFSRSFWSQATIARVYTLNAFFCLLCLYYIFLWLKTRQQRHYSAFFIALGLGLANHTLVMVCLLIMAGWIIHLLRKGEFCLRTGFWGLTGILLGLSLYIYIPLRANMSPPLCVGNPVNLRSLFLYLTRSDYWDKRYIHNLDDIWRVLRHYIRQLPREVTWLGIAALAFGCLEGWRLNRGFFLSCIALYLLNILIVSLHGSYYDIFWWSRYIIPGLIGLIMISGFGLHFWTDKISNPFIRSAAPILIPVTIFWINYPYCDHSRNTLAYDYNMAILNQLPEGAVLVPLGDNHLYPLMYLHLVKGIRPDIHLSATELSRKGDFKKERIFVSFFPSSEEIPENYHMITQGLVIEMVKDKNQAKPGLNTEWNINPQPGDVVYWDQLNKNLLGHYLLMKAAQEKGFPKRLAIIQQILLICKDDPIMLKYVAQFFLMYGYPEPARQILARIKAVNIHDSCIDLLQKEIDKLPSARLSQVK